MPSETMACHCSSGLSGATGWRCSRTCVASWATCFINGLRSEKISNGNSAGLSLRSHSALCSLIDALMNGCTMVRYRPRLISETRRTAAKRRSFSGSGWTMARTSPRVRGSKRTIQSPPISSWWAASAVRGVMTASYRPGGSTSIRSMLEANSWCSFLATPPETKMPRWPTLSCTA